MQVLLLISFSVSVSVWVPSSRGTPLQELNHLVDNKAALTKPDVTEDFLITDDGKDDGIREDVLEDLDFEDDNDFEKSYYQSGFVEPNLNVMTHFQQKKNEILIPCFGMWWPIGGPSYDYSGDYYGDDRKKRRRSRKQNRAAKMKKKKT